MLLRAFVLLATGLALTVGGGPAAAQGGADIYVTPRFWYTFIGEKTINSVDFANNFAEASENVGAALYGGTIAIVPKGLGGTALNLTAFYGSGSGAYRALDGGGLKYRGDQDISRLDVEGLFQIPLGKGGAYWAIGGRYVNIDVDIKGRDDAVPAAQPFRFKDKRDIYLAELGIGAIAPITPKHRFFGGVTVVAGYEHVRLDDQCCGGFTELSKHSGAVVGIDANAGFAIDLAPAVTFTGRYRVFALSDLGFDFKEAVDIVHGPEVSLTFKLN